MGSTRVVRRRDTGLMSYPTSPPPDPQDPFTPTTGSPLGSFRVGSPPSGTSQQPVSSPPYGMEMPVAGLPQVPYQQPYSPPPYPQPLYVQLPPTSGMAVTSMIFGIIGLMGGWCLFGLPCLVAVILGHVGLAQTHGGRMSGRGMAIAGLVMGYIVVIPAALISIFVVFAGAAGSTSQ